MFDQIGEAVGVLQDYPFVPNSHIIEMLVALEFEREIAVQMMVFIPMAYLRALLAPQGVPFPSICKLRDNSGASWTAALPDEPIFVAACEHAQKNIARGMAREHIQGIILRSCEFPSVKRQLDEETAPNDLQLDPPEANIDGDGEDEPELEPEPAPTSWWKFW